MKKTQSRKGYILLLTVLVVGVLTTSVAITILLLGLSIERNAHAIQQSTQAFANAWSCAEHAIYNLRQDLSYSGDETLVLPTVKAAPGGVLTNLDTECTIYPIGGVGNSNRIICTEGRFGNFTVRRLQITLVRVFPSVQVELWEEVPDITLCDS